MNKWTPGPWAVDAELIRGANLAIVASTWSGIRGDASDATPSDRARAMEANARLIAAAPEMYDALKMLVESPNTFPSHDKARAEELLARINGESQ